MADETSDQGLTDEDLLEAAQQRLEAKRAELARRRRDGLGAVLEDALAGVRRQADARAAQELETDAADAADEGENVEAPG